MTRYENKVVDTGKYVEEELDELGAPGLAVILMRERQRAVTTPGRESVLATAR